MEKQCQNCPLYKMSVTDLQRIARAGQDAEKAVKLLTEAIAILKKPTIVKQ